MLTCKQPQPPKQKIKGKSRSLMHSFKNVLCSTLHLEKSIDFKSPKIAERTYASVVKNARPTHPINLNQS